MENIKTYAAWEGNLDDYLNSGDKVDDEMYEHFLNILPPLIDTKNMLQVSEPYDHVNGKAVFATFIRKEGYWIYAGNCYKGESIARIR